MDSIFNIRAIWEKCITWTKIILRHNWQVWTAQLYANWSRCKCGLQNLGHYDRLEPQHTTDKELPAIYSTTNSRLVRLYASAPRFICRNSCYVVLNKFYLFVVSWCLKKKNDILNKNTVNQDSRRHETSKDNCFNVPFWVENLQKRVVHISTIKYHR